MQIVNLLSADLCAECHPVKAGLLSYARCIKADWGYIAAQAVEALKKLNVPYLVSLPLVFQTTEEWLESELGVHPVQVALQVSA